MRNLIGLASVAALAACSAGNGATRHEDGGPTVTRNFAVGAFDSVSLAGSDNVRVVQGATSSVIASGPAGVLDKLDVRIDGSTLRIGRKHEGWNINWNHHDHNALVTVTMPRIVSASVAGSGDMSVDKVAGDTFDAAVAGSGNLTLGTMKVGRAQFSIAGSGDAVAAGTADSAELSIAGSGDIDAGKLATQTADISIVGSGSASVTAHGSADVSIAGSGDVTVTGTGKCRISKMGSGDVTCRP